MAQAKRSYAPRFQAKGGEVVMAAACVCVCDECADDPHKRPVHTARAELAMAVRELGVDELRVLARIARRLAMGARQCGVLDVESDQRDFAGKEAREELEDGLVYFACAWLKREAMKGGAQ